MLTSDFIASVRLLLYDDCHLTVRQIQYFMAKEMCIDCSHTTIHSIMKNELVLRKVCSHWVPRMLTEDHKAQRMAAALDFLMLYREVGESMLDRIVMGNETWVHHYTPSMKQQSMVWKTADEPAPKKFKAVRSARKVLYTVFWDS